MVFILFSCSEMEANEKDDPQNDQTPWQLVWADEFDSESVDPDKWNKLLWRPYYVNNEEQAYTDRDTNIFVRDGKLVIRALIEPGYVGEDYAGNSYVSDYTSGRLNTAGKADWTYGRFDIRAKLPGGRGSWPAIWMLGSNIESAGWPHCGEIDILEHVGYDEGNVHASIHTTDYNHMNGTQKTGNIHIPTTTDSFHVYSLEWDETYMRFLVDDEDFLFIYNDSNGDVNKWPFNEPCYMILNVAVGGMWGGVQGIDPSAFPMEMEVDYVRVYERVDSLRTVDVTFQVDMKNKITSGTGVWISGGNISSGQPGGLVMSSIPGTTIWQTTLTLPQNTDYTYKFRNGHFPNSWSGGWESVPIECSADEFNNRFLSVGAADTTLPPLCFSSCTTCE